MEQLKMSSVCGEVELVGWEFPGGMEETLKYASVLVRFVSWISSFKGAVVTKRDSVIIMGSVRDRSSDTLMMMIKKLRILMS